MKGVLDSLKEEISSKKEKLEWKEFLKWVLNYKSRVSIILEAENDDIIDEVNTILINNILYYPVKSIVFSDSKRLNTRIQNAFRDEWINSLWKLIESFKEIKNSGRCYIPNLSKKSFDAIETTFNYFWLEI